MNRKELKLLLLKYTEGIAIRYFRKHYRLFLAHSLSIDDLKQECKVICLSLFKQYIKQEGINGFNIKKFIARAVGWRMRDLMRKSVRYVKKNVSIENTSIPDERSQKRHYDKKTDTSEYVNFRKSDFFDVLDSKTTLGFNIPDLVERLTGTLNDSEIKILKMRVDNKQYLEIERKIGIKAYKVSRLWRNKIIPVIKKTIKSNLLELKD